MSAAVIGLILLQIFWIENVHFVANEQFEEDVESCLENTVMDLEKIEAALLMNPESFEQGLTDIVKSEFGSAVHYEDATQVRDTTVFENGEMIKYLVITGAVVDTTTGLRSEHKVLTKDFQGDIVPVEQNSVLTEDDSNSLFIQLNKSFERQIMTKAQKLNELVVKMFAENLFDDIAFRLDLEVLDSVIVYNLEHMGMDTNFTFNVVDVQNRPVSFTQSAERMDSTLTGGRFETLLFPNDIVPSQYKLLISFPEQSFIIWKTMTGTLIGSFLLVAIVVIAFYFAVTTIYRQKKLSEIKNDFISNMTHELKTPISTISLACEAAQDPDVANNSETINSFIGMIDQENKRLAKLVENVLQTALLDKGKLKLKLSEVRVDRLVNEVVEAFQIQFRDKGGDLTIEHSDALNWDLDRIHFSNVVYNLLDNSLKYCDKSPEVQVRLEKIKNGFTLTVKDNGIGIKKEDQQRIFENLYRVPTGDVHDVKGFGLGLSYVSSIVQLHGGEIDLESTWGTGSTFKITIKNE